MTGRERIQTILEGKEPDRNGFWMGDIHIDCKQQYFDYFGVADEVGLAVKLGSDIIWRHGDKGAWRHPDKELLFGTLINADRTQDYACLAECEDAMEVEKLPMPDTGYFDFGELKYLADRAHEAGLAFFSGMWAPFFHIVSDSFGMENYFVKMYEQPEVVEALTKKVLDFYLEANKMCFDRLADKIDAYFFGNDLGTQVDLIISPEMYERFILPGITRLVGQAKSYGLKVVMHSCGAIDRIIPSLIEIGVDAIHPIQAKANNMDAKSLAAKYGNDLIFMGGVDAQELIPFGTPSQIETEVKRLTGIFGSRLIVSPSHEKILPGTMPENIEAIARAVGAMKG